jgi:hypothetical protein
MKRKTIKNRILKILASDKDANEKYLQARKFFVKMFYSKTPIAELTNQQKIERTLFALNKVYLDEETPILFKQLLPDSDINKTSDFLKFLEKIINEEKG